MFARVQAGIVLALLAGCAPAVPTEALRNANTAYDAVSASSEPLLRDLSAAERRLFVAEQKHTLTNGDIVVPLSFAPADAGYVASIGDPMLTAAIRHGLRVAGDYFRLLTILAQGQTVDAAQAQINVLASSVATLVNIGTAGAGGAIVEAVAAGLQPAIRSWAEQRNAAELKRLVLEGRPSVDALLAQLQAKSKEMFDVLTAQPRRAATSDPAEARRAVLQIRDETVAVGNYVVLIAALREALGALAAAVAAPGSDLSLAALSESTNNLVVQAQAAARAAEIIHASEKLP